MSGGNLSNNCQMWRKEGYHIPYLSKMVRPELKYQYFRTFRHGKDGQAASDDSVKASDSTVDLFTWLQKAHCQLPGCRFPHAASYSNYLGCLNF